MKLLFFGACALVCLAVSQACTGIHDKECGVAKTCYDSSNNHCCADGQVRLKRDYGVCQESGHCFHYSSQRCCPGGVPSNSFNCNGCASWQKKCGSQCINPWNFLCCNGVAKHKDWHTQCGTSCAKIRESECINNVVVPICNPAHSTRCGNVCQKFTTDICCNDQVKSATDYKKCNNGECVAKHASCSSCPAGEKYCGSSCFNPNTHYCCAGNAIKPKSGYAMCSNSCYNTNTQICCDGHVKDRTSWNVCFGKCMQVATCPTCDPAVAKQCSSGQCAPHATHICCDGAPKPVTTHTLCADKLTCVVKGSGQKCPCTGDMVECGDGCRHKFNDICCDGVARLMKEYGKCGEHSCIKFGMQKCCKGVPKRHCGKDACDPQTEVMCGSQCMKTSDFHCCPSASGKVPKLKRDFGLCGTKCRKYATHRCCHNSEPVPWGVSCHAAP